MAGSLNIVQLIGNLGRDPEVRKTQDGSTIVTLNVACSESWKTKSGEKKEKTEWVRCVIFNENIGSVAERYLKKGSKVYLQGSMSTRKWTDKDNIERYTTEVVLGAFNSKLVLLGDPGGGRDRDEDRDAGGGDTGDRSWGGGSRSATGTGSTGGGGWDASQKDLDDEIPF